MFWLLMLIIMMIHIASNKSFTLISSRRLATIFINSASILFDFIVFLFQHMWFNQMPSYNHSQTKSNRIMMLIFNVEINNGKRWFQKWNAHTVDHVRWRNLIELKMLKWFMKQQKKLFHQIWYAVLDLLKKKTFRVSSHCWTCPYMCVFRSAHMHCGWLACMHVAQPI